MKEFIQNIEELKISYQETLSLYRDDAKDTQDDNPHLSSRFIKFYQEAIFSKQLEEFNALNFYWFNLLEAVLEVIAIHDNFEISDDLEMSESEDELFNFWHDSNLAKTFLNNLNESKDLLGESKKLLLLLEENLISFFHLQIDREISPLTINLKYITVPELGDDNNFIYAKKYNSHIKIDYIENSVVGNISIPFTETTVFQKQINEFNVITYPALKERKNFIENKITKAVNTLQSVVPDLYKVLTAFTQFILPIDEKGIVSYSMQTLPGYSSINIFDRDDIDLLDDLLHENGHHVLNYYLNQEELLEELEEKIYYSPWRRALRPIRGIYHAYMTFYWALELFAQLSTKLNLINDLDSNKIHRRLLEEYYMLKFCEYDLEKAYSNEIISERGYEVYKLFKSKIDSHESLIEKIENEKSFTQVKELKEVLAQARETYYQS